MYNIGVCSMGALNFIFHNSAAGLIDLGTIVSIFVFVGVIYCRGFYFSDAALPYQQEVKIPGK